MFEHHSCNIKPIDSFFRFAIGTIVVIYSFYISNYYFLIFAASIYFTAYRKFCFLYYVLKINERYSVNNYYLTFLPKHNPLPVLIFDKKGDVLFKNESAKNSIKCEKSILDITDVEYQEIIAQDKSKVIMSKYQDIYYQIQLKGISKENFLLAYFTDVTEVIKLNDEIEETQREIIYAMGEIGETRSKETGNHVKRVALYSYELAILYGLSKEESSKIQMASPMHDIGKVGIPDAILNAPRKLTFEEFEIMKTHASLGYNMLKNSNKSILQAAAIVANEHHEKFDGSGYPNGKKAQDIHIYGRITAVADVFDALGSDRVYKKAWKLEEILELFEKESGKHFDPKLVKLFMDNLDIFLNIRDRFVD